MSVQSLILQTCEDCTAVQYPQREICSACLSGNLVWRDMPASGQLLSVARIHFSLEAETPLPLSIASIKLDCGPELIAILSDPELAIGSPVALSFSDGRYYAAALHE